MPRLRCHWALLAQTKDALAAADRSFADLVREFRADYFAGGVAPDALRLFAGADKLSTHFYDDQSPDTWHAVLATIMACHPEVADARSVGDATRAWMAGYLAHIAGDIAYWRHVLPLLPPFPERADAHHGAWLIADDMAIPDADRHLDPASVDYASAPPWVESAAVQRMLARLQDRILVDGMWAVEVAYFKARPEAAGRSDADLLAEHVPAWRSHLAEASDLIPSAAWDAFRADALERGASLIRAYLTGRPAAVPPARS